MIQKKITPGDTINWQELSKHLDPEIKTRKHQDTKTTTGNQQPKNKENSPKTEKKPQLQRTTQRQKGAHKKL